MRAGLVAVFAGVAGSTIVYASRSPPGLPFAGFWAPWLSLERFYFFLLSVIVLVPFEERVGSPLWVILEPCGGSGGAADP